MTIQLTDAAKHYRELKHQVDAWRWLQGELTAEQLKAFAERFRNAPKPVDLRQALQLIREFEGCHLAAYRCPAGVWTIGWGTTQLNGRPVREGDRITQEQADRMLLETIEQKILPAFASSIPYWELMHDAQKAALVSFGFNLGWHFYRAEGFETISRVLEQRQWGEVPEVLLLYRNPGSSFEEGLRRRREAEGRLWASGLPTPAPEPARLRPSSPFTARLTPNIRLGEFALDREERRFHHQHQVDTAAELAAFLQRVRQQFGGRPLVITSGYRPPAVNRSVGGASASEHLYSGPGVGAVDFYVEGVNIHHVQEWCDRHWPYSVGYGAPKGFVHLGIRQGRPRVRWDY